MTQSHKDTPKTDNNIKPIVNDTTSKLDTSPEDLKNDESKNTENSKVEEPVEELSELDSIKKELAEKEKIITELQDKLLRAHAKSKNVERQAKKDADLRIFESKKRLLSYSIDVKDNIDRALVAEWPENTETHRQGIELISQSVDDLLGMSGVIEIKAKGEMYDIIKHLAISSIPYDGPENRVIDELEKGYLLDGRVLRPAKVIVSVKPKKESPKKENTEEKSDKSKLEKESTINPK